MFNLQCLIHGICLHNWFPVPYIMNFYRDYRVNTAKFSLWQLAKQRTDQTARMRRDMRLKLSKLFAGFLYVNGGKLKEFEGSNCFFHRFFYV